MRYVTSLHAISLVTLFLTVYNLKAQTSVTISGYVFNDVNNNGIKDVNEKGIKDVSVSDQVNVVTTNEEGLYEIKYTSSYGILFVSVPAGYQSSKIFWQKVDSTNAKAQINFPLTKISVSASFTFIQASDTHVSETSLDRMQKFRNIVDSVKPDFVIVTGDLVRDALRVPEAEATRLYELFLKEIKK